MPSAAFSPFTTQASTSSSERRPARRSWSALRPGAPTTSAMKRMRTAAELSALRDSEARGRIDLERDVVATVRPVAGERLLLVAADVRDRAELGRSGGDVRSDGERRVGSHVLDRHDEG